jgi:serine/threonine-protein kinase
MVVGTLRFMAPEQAAGESVDRRSDVYSLGVVVYYLLTGAFPFEGSTTLEILRALTDSNPIPPSHHVEMSPAMDRVILKCLEKDPNNRFQTVAEFIEELDAAAGYLPEVDLKSMIRGIRKEVKEIEEMDQMITGAKSFVAPLRPVPHPVSPDTGMPVATPQPSGPLHPAPSISPSPPLPQPVLSPEESVITPPDPRPRITLVTEDSDKRPYFLQQKTTIGRSSDNDIVVMSALVSRYHAELTVEGENCYIKDLNSSSGTWVSGERIINSRLLRNGDAIQIADSCFIFNNS